MLKRDPFKCLKTSPEIIRLAVMMCVRFLLSPRNMEDLLDERGIDISHESVRFWTQRFGLMFAAEIRKNRAELLRSGPQWRHFDEDFVKINGERHYLWPAGDHEGEVLESFVTRKRDKKAELKFLKKTMRRYGRPLSIVTDLLHSYGAALKKIGALALQETGRWLNNRAENSHLPLRRRERAPLVVCRQSTRGQWMQRFGAREVCRYLSRFTPRSTTIKRAAQPLFDSPF